MKMRFSRRHSALSPSARVALICVGVGAVVLLALRFVFPGAFIALTTPLFQIGSSLSSSFLVFESTQKMDDERRALRVQVETLQNENLILKASLRDAGVLEHADGDVLAGVLARPPLTPYDVLVVNRGTRDGVVIGALAFAKGGVPIGRVADALQDSARIALFSSAGQMTDGWVGEKRVPITLRGEGAGAFSAEVPRESEIVSGEMVYVAGGGARAIGTVTDIKSEASSPQADVSIRPLISPFSIPWVSIGKPFL